MSQSKNTFGIISFISALVGFFTCGLGGLIAIVFGAMGLAREPKTFAIIGLILGVLEVLICIPISVSVAVPSFIRAREISRRNACQENLVSIDIAKESWQLDNNVSAHSTPTWDDLVGPEAYLIEKPVCHSGGSYTIGHTEENAECSLKDKGEFPHINRTVTINTGTSYE